MPYVKPTVHLSRLAGTALKSFTHGYAQTVVAASQSSYAAQNTPPGPLADTLIGRIRKNERSRLHSSLHNVDGARHASTSSNVVGQGRSEAGQPDSGLDKYFDAWQKHQRNGTNEWQQYQFARRIEWQPPTTVPTQTQEASAVEGIKEQESEKLVAPGLKRSYTTSALDNFGKAFSNDELAEAVALEQVNNAIAEEIQKSKDDSSVATLAQDASEATVSDRQSLSSPITSTPITSASSVSEVDYFAQEIERLSEHQQYDRIPAAFEAMLRAGVRQPAPAAYRALLVSALELTQGKHQKVPKALEVYSDMLRRRVTPDSETFNLLIDLLAKRTLEIKNMQATLDQRLLRYGGLEEQGKFMFRSTEAEHSILLEDSSLTIALKLFDRAHADDILVSDEATAALVIACAEAGRISDMSRLYQRSSRSAVFPQSSIHAPVIVAYGLQGDLKSAVEVYDDYRDLAIAHNAGETELIRRDNDVYAAIIKAYGSSDRLKGGLKLFSGVQATITDETELNALREVVALQALLPVALKEESLGTAMDLTRSLTGFAHASSLAAVVIAAADRNLSTLSTEVFDALAKTSHDLSEASAAMLAMHVRNANVQAAEPFWTILESAFASSTLIEPTTMRAVALIGVGQAERGLRQSRRMFARIRESQPETVQVESIGQIDEAIALMGNMLLRGPLASQPEVGVELLRMMSENGGLVFPTADHIVAFFGPEQISRLGPADIELLLRVQSGMILDESSADIAGPARFACLLDQIVSRSMMPASETEALIEKTLVNLDRAELSRLWNSYRYPQTPAFSPTVPFVGLQSGFDESFDPYAARTDVKGSNAINELLERPQGRRTNEALAKFRNMRRVGRVPRMFTYGKLIEGAAKENNLHLAHDILAMAKQDVPYDVRYRVVRFGWHQILDHMVAGCLTMGRRDLAAQYHQDLLDMGAAPTANTFGLYITTLKESTKTFDEASEAVKIFLRAKAEGVEPSSFLYNALIGKLGKARRIDDCLFYFAEMRKSGVRPTSVTYGTIVNALCRVSDEKFAEEIFEEMESCSNYKPRPAPYHSLMQFFLTTKRDRSKVVCYYERMRSKGIEPTVHTYKLLIDTHATLEPTNMPAAEAVIAEMLASGVRPEAVHYASLIHAKGCVMHDIDGARKLFDDVIGQSLVAPQPCLYQALFESLNANHLASESEALLADMDQRGVEFTPYIANALIHGWTLERVIDKARAAFERVPRSKREPSTYEAMVRAHLACEDRDAAKAVVREALSRGYPSAVAGKISELVR